MAELKIVKKKKAWIEYDYEKDFEIIKERLTGMPDEWWKELCRVLKEGGAPRDQFNHYEQFHIKVHPILKDMFSVVRQTNFKWFKTDSDAIRSIFNTGLKIALASKNPRSGKRTKFEKALAGLEAIAQLTRMGDFNDQIATIRQKVIMNRSKNGDPRQTIEIADLIEQYAKDILDEINVDEENEEINYE